MKIWTWIKSLSWIAIAGAIVTAVLMVLGGAKVGRQERRAERAEKQFESMAHDRTKKGIDKAAKLQKAAVKHKEKAAATRQRTEARLQELGDKDETMADIADRFNKRKLRD
jgi:biopolymer transport protein ExbB/TolQ